jgi:hypothetical protein
MNPTKEILDQFEVIKIKFDKLNEPGKNGKLVNNFFIYFI